MKYPDGIERIYKITMKNNEISMKTTRNDGVKIIQHCGKKNSRIIIKNEDLMDFYRKFAHLCRTAKDDYGFKISKRLNDIQYFSLNKNN